MKKLRLFTFIFIMLFSLTFFAGCKKDSEKDQTYKVEFVYEDGTIIEEKSFEISQELEVFAPEKEGYTFIGWYLDGVKIELPFTFESNAKVVAKYEIDSYQYQFVVDGEIIKQNTGTYGSNIEYPENPTKEATAEYIYEFTGWDNEDKTLTQDVVFNAIFNSIKREYTYKFLDCDGSLLKEAKGEYGALPVEPEAPKKDGYIFIGWDKEVSIIEGDVEYTAVFEKETISSLEGLKVSILGDSISTFYAEGSAMNSYYGGENQFFYPRYSQTIKTVDKTWWYQLITNNKMELGINNSWSGSAAAGNGDSAGQSDARINTIDDNGTPDVVIIFLGTNDCGSQYINLQQYEAALKTMIKKINALCDAEIFVTSLGHATHNLYMANRDDYNASIKSIAKEYGCTIVPLDDYIVEDNCKIYLEDSLHYNAKGAALVAKIYEKTIKEHFGIPFEGEIEVEHQEKLPEGVLGKITATAGKDFWVGTTYAEHVFLESSGFSNALYSLRIQIEKNAENGKYYVSSIHKSGDTGVKITSDYVLVISSSHPEFKALSGMVENVVVGSVVEFSEPVEFPVEIIFKESDGNGPTISEPEPEPEPTPDFEVPEDAIAHIIATASTGFYSTYTEDVFLAESSKFESAKFSFRYQITKNQENGKYYVTGIHKSGDAVKFDSDYVITISEAHENRAQLINSLSSVEIGSIVEFDETLSFPVLIVFKEGDGNAPSE